MEQFYNRVFGLNYKNEIYDYLGKLLDEYEVCVCGMDDHEQPILSIIELIVKELTKYDEENSIYDDWNTELYEFILDPLTEYSLLIHIPPKYEDFVEYFYETPTFSKSDEKEIRKILDEFSKIISGLKNL